MGLLQQQAQTVVDKCEAKVAKQARIEETKSFPQLRLVLNLARRLVLAEESRKCMRRASPFRANMTKARSSS